MKKIVTRSLALAAVLPLMAASSSALESNAAVTQSSGTTVAATTQVNRYVKSPFFDTVYEIIAFNGGSAAVPMTFERWVAAGGPKPVSVNWVPQAMTVAHAYVLKNGQMVQTQDLFAISMNSRGIQTAWRLSFAQWQAAGHPMPTAQPVGLAPHIFIFKYPDSPDLYANIDSNTLTTQIWRNSADKLTFDDWRAMGYPSFQTVPRV